MRTEDDLRAALTSLEQHAPVTVRVIFVTSRRLRLDQRLRPSTRWLAGIATAAALAGVVTALTLPGGTSRTIPNGGMASSAPVTKATLQAKILAAFSAIGDQIAYMHEVSTALGTDKYTDHSPLVGEYWTYPNQPRPGQLVRYRHLYYSLDGKFHSDSEMIYPAPAPQPGPPSFSFTVKGDWIQTDYVGKTWSDQKHVSLPVNSQSESALIASYFKSKQWTARNTTLNGRAAIELTLKEKDLQGQTTVNSWTEYLWVDARTYLPLHDVITFGPPKEATHIVDDFEYLPPTPANLAKLTPPIPAGFKRVFPEPLQNPKLIVPSPASSTVSPAPSASPSPR